MRRSREGCCAARHTLAGGVRGGPLLPVDLDSLYGATTGEDSASRLPASRPVLTPSSCLVRQVGSRSRRRVSGSGAGSCGRSPGCAVETVDIRSSLNRAVTLGDVGEGGAVPTGPESREAAEGGLPAGCGPIEYRTRVSGLGLPGVDDASTAQVAAR